MVFRRLVAAAVGLALLGAGCSSSGSEIVEDGDELSAPPIANLAPIDLVESPGSIDDAKAAWQNASIDNYRISATERRNFWSRGCIWITTVIAGEVTESVVDPASTGTNCGERELTVEELHDLIAQMTIRVEEFSVGEAGDNALKVTYDDLGVPDWIGFDLPNVIDEEISLRVTFTVHTEETLAALDAEIESPSEILALAVEVALDDAKIAWANANIDNYRVSATESRNIWATGCTLHNVVVDGQVVESTTDNRSSENLREEWPMSVEALHERMSQMASDIGRYTEPVFGEHTLDVEYNNIGVPEAIEFDLANFADEETSLRVTFTILP